MKELFDDILKIKDVDGAMFFSLDGELVFKEFLFPPTEVPESQNWWQLFINSLNGARGVDLVFEKSRVYVRKTEAGYLLIVMRVYAPTAMIRLSCDLLLPSLKRMKTTKGFRGLFRRKK